MKNRIEVGGDDFPIFKKVERNPVSLFGCTDAMVGIICRNLSSNYHELNHYDRFAQRHTLSAGKLLRSAESI